jgi:hypothetical protein
MAFLVKVIPTKIRIFVLRFQVGKTGENKIKNTTFYHHAGCW